MSEAKIKISANTIAKYIEHLKDAFLVSEALRYDIKGRKYIGTDSKYYFEDPGVRNAILGFHQVEFNIQSAYMLPDEAKTAQELRPFKYIGDEFRKVIISGDYMRGFYNNEGIYRIGIYNFLTDSQCLE